MAADTFHAVDWLLKQRKGVGGPEPEYWQFGIALRLKRQELAAIGLQYYLVVPMAIVAAAWIMKQQLQYHRARAHQSTENRKEMESIDSVTGAN
jgi:hypothetical protein